MSKLNIIIAAVAVVALVIGLKLWHSVPVVERPGGLNATVISPPKAIEKFSLLDSKGKPFTNNSVWMHWTFMVFGSASQHSEEFSKTMETLSNMYKVLQTKKLTPVPLVVFVSVDPAKDSLKVLNKFTAKYNPDFIAVTGDMKQVALLSQEVPSNQKDAILLLDSSGKLVGIFPSPHHAATMVKDFQIIVQNAG